MDDKKILFQQIIKAFKSSKFTKSEAETSLYWIRKYLSFHNLRNPAEMGATDVREFLSDLSKQGTMPSKQKEAYDALDFFYNKVLDLSIWSMTKAAPVVEEATADFNSGVTEATPEWVARLQEPFKLIARLTYGCGMHLEEVLNLRIEDVQLEKRHIVLRDAFGDETEMMLSDNILQSLALQLRKAHLTYKQDSREGATYVHHPRQLTNNQLVNKERWNYLFSGGVHFNLQEKCRVRYPMDVKNVKHAFRQAAQGPQSATNINTATRRQAASF
ncbi:phage integrase N-terminal SAM-like domain-containing protein [Pleionea sp. CnH1-48]|uniref:phage integrase N-terminal SAM-like domain-containing protein n=1 Tax=Pleionea sp. CnH1-48 TaxID=2954494 RepID=UPI002097AD0C|nr:phage integrase N-terminal SAM-like domain-containing protein [Pleionea sp. CnH1-48]MCO7225555.1 phage integrase N-terminal SAM-like domain-containing protein [Pleionea sp. CnH1-48]